MLLAGDQLGGRKKLTYGDHGVKCQWPRTPGAMGESNGEGETMRNFWTPCEVVSSASCPVVIFSVPMTGVDPTKQKMIAKHSAWNGVSGYVKYTEWLLRGYYIFNSSLHFATQFLRFFALLL